MEAVRNEDGLKGITTVFGWDFDTTGVLGLGGMPCKDIRSEAFRGGRLCGRSQSIHGPALAFLLRLAVPLQWARLSPLEPWKRHLRRDLAPSGRELKHIGASIWDHARLRFPKGEEAKRYNVLQKLAYLGVALILLPLMLLTGLAMSPGMDAAFPLLIDMFGGRRRLAPSISSPQASWCSSS